MKSRCVLLLSLLLVVRVSAAPETLRPEQLKPGMKGYGLSVFRGTTPEKFDVEIIGVLKNAFPKQDMILIRCSGAGLEKHKTIAGMSGSPIYVNGKRLVGKATTAKGEAKETDIENTKKTKADIVSFKMPVRIERMNNPQLITCPASGHVVSLFCLFESTFANCAQKPLCLGAVHHR